MIAVQQTATRWLGFSSRKHNPNAIEGSCGCVDLAMCCSTNNFRLTVTGDSKDAVTPPRIERAIMKVCFPLHRKRGVIFRDLQTLCVDLDPPSVLSAPLVRTPAPFVHLQSLATILTLTSSLPEQLPMRNELRSLALRALDAAVADLGDDVQLGKEDVGKPTYKK
jgi:hypothetical protein